MMAYGTTIRNLFPPILRNSWPLRRIRHHELTMTRKTAPWYNSAKMDRIPTTRARKQLMRKKIFIGVFLAAVASVVAGEYLLKHSDAQDAPKKAAVEQKSESPPPLVFPPLPSPTPPEAKDAPPTFPAIAPKDNGLTIPPPTL